MDIVKKLLLAVRSLLFYIGYGGTGMFQGIICKCLSYFLPVEKHYTYTTTWNKFVIWWFNVCIGVKVYAEGLENIPDTPCVVISKHQSPWETMYLLPHFNPLTVILKKELLRIPFFGAGLKSLNPIAIDRSSPKEALKQVLNIGQERLADGYSVLVFPEGTRIEPGKVGNYARSGTALSIAANVPTILVAHNAGYCWPARKFLKLPGTIQVKFSEPVYPEGKTSKQFIEEAKTWIENEVAKMSSGETPIPAVQ